MVFRKSIQNFDFRFVRHLTTLIIREKKLNWIKFHSFWDLFYGYDIYAKLGIKNTIRFSEIFAQDFDKSRRSHRAKLAIILPAADRPSDFSVSSPPLFSDPDRYYYIVAVRRDRD